MYFKFFSICIISILFFFGCDKDNDPKEEILMLEISAETKELAIVPSETLTTHMIAKEVNSTNTIYIPLGGIANFQYTKGYSYVVRVRKTYLKEQVQDSDNIVYTLLEIISTNENLN